MIRIDTVRVDKAESKEDLYLMSLRVSADNKGLKELSNALDNVIYTIEHSEALLSEPVGLIEDEDAAVDELITNAKRRGGRRPIIRGDITNAQGEALRFGIVGKVIEGPVRIVCMDKASGEFSYVSEEPQDHLKTS